MNLQQKKIGIIFGKFYPIHLGHVYMILDSCTRVSELHILVCINTSRDEKLFIESNMIKQPSSEDRVKWVEEIFSNEPKIKVHYFNEDGVPSYPNGWEQWSNKVKCFFDDELINPNVIFSSEPQDIKPYRKLFGIDAILIDPLRTSINISATEVRNDPIQKWDYLPSVVKPFFSVNISIVGINSALYIKYLSNIINASNSLEDTTLSKNKENQHKIFLCDFKSIKEYNPAFIFVLDSEYYNKVNNIVDKYTTIILIDSNKPIHDILKNMIHMISVIKKGKAILNPYKRDVRNIVLK